MVSQTPKQRAAELLGRLPDDASYDEIQHVLHTSELIRQRVAKSKQPDTQFLTTDQAKQKLSKWLTD